MAMQQSREGVHIGEDWMDDSHWPHCFDYLRSVSLHIPRKSIGTSLLSCASRQCVIGWNTRECVTPARPIDDGTFMRVIDGWEGDKVLP
jgi:hypothetical protein